MAEPKADNEVKQQSERDCYATRGWFVCLGV